MGILINIQVLPPNQSLKLTEPAVDDFARANKQLLLDWTYHARTGYAATRLAAAP